MNANVDITGVKLETERLILREWTLDDLDDFFAYAKNPDVGPHAGWFPHENKEKSLEILNKFIADKKTFAIVYKENNKVIGSLGIERYGSEDKLSEFFDYQGREIGYVLSKDYWGQGSMRKCLKYMTLLAFDLGFDQVRVGSFIDNLRSIHLIEASTSRVFSRTFSINEDVLGLLKTVGSTHL